MCKSHVEMFIFHYPMAEWWLSWVAESRCLQNSPFIYQSWGWCVMETRGSPSFTSWKDAPIVSMPCLFEKEPMLHEPTNRKSKKRGVWKRQSCSGWKNTSSWSDSRQTSRKFPTKVGPQVLTPSMLWLSWIEESISGWHLGWTAWRIYSSYVRYSDL